MKIFLLGFLTTITCFVYGQDKYNYISFNRLTEIEGFGDKFRRTVCEHQKRERADGDFFAVPELVRRLERGEAVMDRVCARQAAAFKSEAAEQCVGFDHAFEGGGDVFGFAIRQGLRAVRHERVKA